MSNYPNLLKFPKGGRKFLKKKIIFFTVGRKFLKKKIIFLQLEENFWRKKSFFYSWKSFTAPSSACPWTGASTWRSSPASSHRPCPAPSSPISSTRSTRTATAIWTWRRLSAAYPPVHGALCRIGKSFASKSSTSASARPWRWTKWFWCCEPWSVSTRRPRMAGRTRSSEEWRKTFWRITPTIPAHATLTLEEFLIWSDKCRLTVKFMRLLFQVCHIVLGLKPQVCCVCLLLSPGKNDETIFPKKNTPIKMSQTWTILNIFFQKKHVPDVFDQFFHRNIRWLCCAVYTVEFRRRALFFLQHKEDEFSSVIEWLQRDAQRLVLGLASFQSINQPIKSSSQA